MLASGAVLVIVAAALAVRFWNIFDAETIEYLEAGGDGGTVTSVGDWAMLLLSPVAAAAGVVLVVVAVIRHLVTRRQ